MHYSTVFLRTALLSLGNEVETILEDRCWNLNDQQIGIYRLTYGNSLKMEAEYKYSFHDTSGVFEPDTLTTDPIDETEEGDTGMGDVYNYIFAHAATCGYRTARGAHSNQYAWVCDEGSGHVAGLALSNPRFRWTVPNHRFPRSIGNDLKFYSEAINYNRLYLTVAMKFDSLAVGEEVATIRLKVLKNVLDNDNQYMDYTIDPDNDKYYEFQLHPVNPEVGTTIYNNAYSSVPRDDEKYGRNILFEYYIEFPDPNVHNNTESDYDSLPVRKNPGDYFRHINPEVYWHGNGRMELDYIVLEDYYHRQARLKLNESPNVDMDILAMMDARLAQIRSLMNSNNIRYFYTKDEPFQGQFSMYDKVESYLENNYGLDNMKIITATNLNDYKITKPNGTSYDHYLNFLAQAKPRTIAIDAYPLQEWNKNELIQWNNEIDSLSVQNLIDNIVTNTYKKIAKAVRHNIKPTVRETEIVYIPQIFGEFVVDSSDDVDYWRYFKPPRSMNKCLQLLPLCYSADGILDYVLLAGDDPHGETGSQYRILAPLKYSLGYNNIRVPDDDSSFENLTEANSKIAVYGPCLKKLHWIDADCLMTNGGSEGVAVSPFLLHDLRVLGPDSPSGECNPTLPWIFYHGFVQCGYYNDDQLSPSFMLVNRRAVKRIENENTVVQLPVDSNFQDVPSQTVVFVPSIEAEGHFGTHICLFDPYDGQVFRKEGTDIRVSIGPGDGKLLEMCGTLPQEVSVNSILSNKSVITGTVSILPGVNVVTDSGTTTRILSNSVINVGDGASYTLRGDVIIEDGASIIVSQNGSLILDNAVCTWGQGSKIEVNGGLLTINGGSMNNYDSSPRWAGIRVNESSLVTINNAIISNADYHIRPLNNTPAFELR